MIKKYYLSLIALLLPLSVKAQSILKSDIVEDINKKSVNFAYNSGFDSNARLGGFIEKGIKGFLSVLGIIFIILIIVAGFNWMNAQGDESKVTKAKETIQRAIIGLIIIAAAYVITYFVFSNLPGANGGSQIQTYP